MKTFFCILAFALLGSNLKGTAQNSETALLEGTWRLIPGIASYTATREIPTLNFDVNDNQVKGNTGCNSFSGTFVIKGSGLRFNDDFVSTKMACPGYNEKAFFKNLHRTTRYKVNGDTLILKAGQITLSYWLKSK
jgi:heat shock protein HslJ